MAKIRVPNINSAVVPRDRTSEDDLDYQEMDVTDEQASHWNALTDAQQLTLVLRADKEERDVREYL
jgi:hypothetical protein